MDLQKHRNRRNESRAAHKQIDIKTCLKLEKRGSMKGQLFNIKGMKNKCCNMENKAYGSIKGKDNQKAAAL
jgi:hypothetical protein